jgi:norsolorinic acid ketoreductase
MSVNTTVLITGAKSGIGKGLLETYALRDNTTVIAGIRDGPDSQAAASLRKITTGGNSKIVVVQYDASSNDAGSVLKDAFQHHGINKLDLVIANAGILKHFGPVLEIGSEELVEHFNINTVAPILLYKSTAPLLEKANNVGKFAIISSNIGSNTMQDSYNMPMLAYGLSKAGVNYAVSRIHREEKDTVVLALQPGWVQTAMGEKAASLVGMSSSDVPVTLEASVSGLVDVLDNATKEEHSGKFWDQTGKQMPW